MKNTKAEKQRGAAISEKILGLEAELIKVRAEIARSEQVCCVSFFLTCRPIPPG